MLKKIYFVLQEKIRKRLAGMAEPLWKEFSEHAVELEGIFRPLAEGLLADNERGLACLEDRIEKDRKKEEILYVTDEAACYHMLKEKGYYVLPCLHEDNRSASFPGASYMIEKIEEMDYSSFEMAYRRLAGLPWEILETQRCRIRETTVEDVAVFYRIYADTSITEYMENLFEDPEEEIAYTQNYIEKIYGFYGYGMWTVLEKSSGRVIGRAGITWQEGFDLPELGFVFGVPWQRQGYAYEVCSAVLDYAREELMMSQVQALVMEGNRKSVALCEKLGFVERSGIVELDGERYQVLVKNLT